jgi:dienelactone hydrolase
VDGADASDFGNCDRYLMRTSHAGSVRIDLDASVFCQTSFVDTPPFPNVSLFSPDNRWAIVNVTADFIRPEWRSYEQADFKTLLALRDTNPKDLYAKLIQELRVVDTRSATSRPLWTVPVNRRLPPRFKWAADSQSVLLWPTFLPVGLSPKVRGLEGEAVAQVDVVTGSVRPFELMDRKASTVSDARWISAEACALEFSDGTVLIFVKQGETWRLNRGEDAVDGQVATKRPRGRYVDLELRQDVNAPPRLFARDPTTKREREVLDLNPGLLSRFSLSRVKFVEWKDDAGRKWRGRLYYPLNHDPAARYPLVIQTHGYAGEDEFSIYGQGDGAPNLGPGWSVYLAQPLAGRGIAVLQVGGPDQSYESLNEMVRSSEAESGLRTAVAHLSNEGLVDADRVGLMAHSSTGRIAEHALTYSPFRFAAAIAADYADGNYLQAALYGWPQFSTELNGDAPFGAGLKSWLTNSPALNAERIRTPLQLQVTSATDGLSALLWHWELFSRLRYLKKPVEYYVVPDITHGSHTLQNPRQLLAIQQRALDWWCFWLKGEESDDPGKREQYASWREMRSLQ